MPFAVTQWGYSPDPRPPDYALTGFDFGQLPPWRWTMKTTGALDPYGALNTGVTWQRTSNTVSFASFLPVVPIPDVTDPFLNFSGTPAPVGGFTVEWFIGFFTTGADPATEGTLTELWPLAIKTRAFTMTNVNGGDPFFPNPLVITPHKWNAA